MEYPHEFSKEAQAIVEAAKIRAGFDLAADGITTRHGFPTRAQMERYIMPVVLAFGRAACELGRTSRITNMSVGFTSLPWSVVRIEKETREFLKQFALEAYLEKSGGHILTSSGYIEQDIWNGFLKSQEWQDFEEARLVIAQIQADPDAISRYLAPVPSALLLPIGIEKSETAKAIERLRAEARITLEELAEELEIHPSTAYRHESGDLTPQPWRVSAYERVFSKLLNRKIYIPVTPIRRK